MLPVVSQRCCRRWFWQCHWITSLKHNAALGCDNSRVCHMRIEWEFWVEYYAETFDDKRRINFSTWYMKWHQVVNLITSTGWCELNDFRLGGVQLKPICLEPSINTGRAVLMLVNFYLQVSFWCGFVLGMTLNCIRIFIVTGSFFYWCVIRPARQRFFIYLRILIISYLATFFALIDFLCWCAVKQSINQFWCGYVNLRFISILVMIYSKWTDHLRELWIK